MHETQTESGRPAARRTLALTVALVVALAAAALAANPAAASGNPGGTNLERTEVVPRCGSGTIKVSKAEASIFRRQNLVRANNGERRLCLAPALMRSARAHAVDMRNRNFFSHITRGGPDAGDTVRDRAREWNYLRPEFSGYRLAENIAWGAGRQGLPGPIFRGWMRSSDHRKNIMDGRMRHVGIGVAYGRFNPPSTDRPYFARVYTVNFGTRHR